MSNILTAVSRLKDVHVDKDEYWVAEQVVPFFKSMGINATEIVVIKGTPINGIIELTCGVESIRSVTKACSTPYIDDVNIFQFKFRPYINSESEIVGRYNLSYFSLTQEYKNEEKNPVNPEPKGIFEYVDFALNGTTLRVNANEEEEIRIEANTFLRDSEDYLHVPQDYMEAFIAHCEAEDAFVKFKMRQMPQYIYQEVVKRKKQKMLDCRKKPWNFNELDKVDKEMRTIPQRRKFWH